MLHNSGPYGPNDVPINMGAPVNMTQISNPMNLGNNLAKMPQQTPQASTPHYNMPDYSSFGHPPLNMGHSMSPFANYHHLNFQTNYGHPNPHLTQDSTPNIVQNSMLPMNLNITSDHGPSLMNYQSFESKRIDVNNTHYRENFSRKMPINIPQIHTKAFHKHLAMDSTYGQYNTIQENPFFSQDSPEKSLIDSNRRKSLENTVKLIENILINSTPKDTLKNLNSTETLLDNTHVNTCVDMSNSKLQSSNHILHPTSSKNLQTTNLDLIHKPVNMQNMNINMNSTDLNSSCTEIKDIKMDIHDIDINLTTKVISNPIIDLKAQQNTNVNENDEKIPKHTKASTSGKTNTIKLSNNTDDDEKTKIQSEIHCEPLRRSLISNNRTLPDDKRKRNEISDPVKEEPIAEVIIKTEIIEDEIDTEAVKVKVETLAWTDDNIPFLKDTNATHRNIVEADAVIVDENNVAEAQEAMKTGTNPKTYYECSHCNLLFKHPKRFLIHTKWHSFGLTNEKRQELAREKELKKSMKKEARIIERLNSKEVKEGAEGDAYPCKDCDKVFAVKSSLKNHRQRYHPTRVRECKVCGASVVGWLALRAHSASHSGPSGHQCPECPKRFKYAHSLAKHRDTHLEKTHGCEQCEKKFGSQALLKMHRKCHERAARGATFRCTYCGKGFFESYNLQVHERTHRNERPFACDICKTSFGTNSSLKRHLKVSHSTAKPFPCPTCQRCFLSAATRARHAARAHGAAAALAHACAACPRRYKAPKELHKHVAKAHPERRE